ncbi:hypothetical protein N2152v2_010721 [Parachlorella kessleri]
MEARTAAGLGPTQAKKAAYSSIIAGFCLLCICVLATSVRLFSIIKYESVIHEFDPFFNARVTQFLTKEGFYNTWNFFDSFTWYPLGRVGLIFTAGAVWNALQKLNIPINIREVCVLTGPVFSAFCALATYGFMKEVRGPGAGLASAALIAVVPSYISRSVAGSYDLESVAIFALVFVFYLYVKTLNTGSLAWATGLFLAYLYMVASWGGYSFIVNLLPIHCLACIVFGRVSSRLYVAYAPFVVLGALAAMNIPVIGFNAVRQSEHFASFFVFGILHVALAIQYIKGQLSPRAYAGAKRLVLTAGAAIVSVVLVLVLGYVAASPTFGWSGRSLSLLDPTYASKYIPIIASVSEHQPPSWSSYFTDLHIATLLAPAGILACFKPLTDASMFLLLYGVTAVYFSGVMVRLMLVSPYVMVRLMLVLAPAACCLAGLALSELMQYLSESLAAPAGGAGAGGPEGEGAGGDDAASADGSAPEGPGAGRRGGGGGAKKAGRVGKAPPCTALRHRMHAAHKRGLVVPGAASTPTLEAARRQGAAAGAGALLSSGWAPLPRDVAIVATLGLALVLAGYVRHSVYVAGEMYSAPSIVLQSRRPDGSVKVFDDFREGYAWLSENTDPTTKVASWWDYGYQTTAMANRTVIVDNNTWNNTHIATGAAGRGWGGGAAARSALVVGVWVGRAMASPERKAWKIFRSLDVEYVFVVFGGFIGYPSDDINKFLWMVRIGGGVFPEIKEPHYLGEGGYRVDAQAGKALLDSTMYRLSYYRFADVGPMLGGPRGFDRVRQTVIGLTDFKLRYFEEVFTSEHWMIRIYKVKDVPNRDRLQRNPHRVKPNTRAKTKRRQPSGAPAA